jgi:hypothetical protein
VRVVIGRVTAVTGCNPVKKEAYLSLIPPLIKQ